MDIPDHVLDVGKALGLVQSLPLVESQKIENRPILCEHCKTVQWSYNLPNHFRSKHSDYPIPKRISGEEEKLKN